MDRAERSHKLIELLNRARARVGRDPLRGHGRVDGPMSACCIGDAG